MEISFSDVQKLPTSYLLIVPTSDTTTLLQPGPHGLIPWSIFCEKCWGREGQVPPGFETRMPTLDPLIKLEAKFKSPDASFYRYLSFDQIFVYCLLHYENLADFSVQFRGFMIVENFKISPPNVDPHFASILKILVQKSITRSQENKNLRRGSKRLNIVDPASISEITEPSGLSKSSEHLATPVTKSLTPSVEVLQNRSEPIKECVDVGNEWVYKKKSISMNFVSIEEFKNSRKVSRVGLLIFRSVNSRIEFFLPYKNSDGTKITDFGGGCTLSKRESPFKCMEREFEEEFGKSIETIPNLAEAIDYGNAVLIKNKDGSFYAEILAELDNFKDLEDNFVPTNEIKGYTIVKEKVLFGRKCCLDLDGSLCYMIREIDSHGGISFE